MISHCCYLYNIISLSTCPCAHTTQEENVFPAFLAELTQLLWPDTQNGSRYDKKATMSPTTLLLYAAVVQWHITFFLLWLFKFWSLW